LSALTKVFVLLLVILSLLLAAASITFLYTVPNFNEQIATLQAGQAAAQAQAERVRAAESASRAAAEQRAGELQNLLSDANAGVASLRGELAKAQAEKADLSGQIAQSNTTQATLSQAVTANMALVNTLRNELAQLREQYQRTLDQNLDLNTAYAKLSNEHEFTERALRAAQEANKELLDQGNNMRAALVKLGQNPDRLTPTDLAPPPINGVVVQRMSIEGEPFALISVGSEDDVKLGMQFMIIDSETSQLLGFITIEEVDDQVSIGKLSGPRVEQVAPNDEVRTQV
jgi:hypothetical protein